MELRTVFPGILVFAACHCLAQPASDAAVQAPPPEEKSDAASQASPPAGTGRIDRNVPIVISDAAPYENAGMIAANVVRECVDLGRQFSDATQKSAAEQGLKIVKNGSVDPAKGDQVLVLKILSAISAGHAWAFGGHRKSVSVKAELYKDGKLLDSYTTTRNSMGGALAGFKGSCDVLERTVNTLGSDIAKWVGTRAH
jgi:hypothetical protein